MGRAYVEIFADSSQMQSTLKVAKARITDFGRRIDAIAKKYSAFVGLMALPAGLSGNRFAQFEDKILAVKAVTGATAEEFILLSKHAKYLGRTTSYTAKQVAAGMLELGRAGYSVGEIMEATQPMLNLSRATGTDLAQSAEIASNVLRSFGIDAKNTSAVADILTATVNNSSQTLEDLGDSMKYTAPLAKEYGLTLTDTAKAMGILANVGIKGSSAGTTMKNILARISTQKTRDGIDKLGVSLSKSNGELKNISELLMDIGKASSGLNSLDRLRVLHELFGIRAITGASKLTKSTFANLDAALNKFADTAENTASTMDSGLGGTLRMLYSAVEGVALAFGNVLKKAFTGVINKVKIASNVLTEFIVMHEDSIVKFVKWSSAVIAAAGGVLLLSKSLVLLAGLPIFAGNLLIAPFIALKNSLKILAPAFTVIKMAALPAMFAVRTAVGLVAFAFKSVGIVSTATAAIVRTVWTSTITVFLLVRKMVVASFIAMRTSATAFAGVAAAIKAAWISFTVTVAYTQALIAKAVMAFAAAGVAANKALTTSALAVRGAYAGTAIVVKSTAASIHTAFKVASIGVKIAMLSAAAVISGAFLTAEIAMGSFKVAIASVIAMKKSLAAATIALKVITVSSYGIMSTAAAAFATILGTVKTTMAGLTALVIAMKAPLLLLGATMAGVFVFRNKDRVGEVFDTVKVKAIDAAKAINPALDGIRYRAGLTFKSVKQSLVSGDYAQAARTMWTAIKLEWSTAIMKLREIWTKFRIAWIKSVTFMQVWGVKIWDYMVQGWIISVSFFKRIWVSTVAAVLKSFNNIVAALKTIGAFFKSFKAFKILGKNGGMLKKIFSGLITVFKTLFKWIGKVAFGLLKLIGFIAKVAGKLVGKMLGFDSKQFQGEYDRIWDDAAEKNEKINSDAKRKKDSISDRQKQRQTEAHRKYAEMIKNIEAEAAKKAAAINGRLSQQKIADQKRAIAAQQNWRKELIKSYKVEQEKPSSKFEEVRGRLDGVGKTINEISSVGTFNPVAAFGLGAGSAMDRTAKATEQTANAAKKTAENTEKLARKSSNGQIRFGA